MPITRSEAVADADHPDDLTRYERALAQVAELAPLVESFIQAIKASGNWPTTPVDEISAEEMVTSHLSTRVSI